MMMCLTPSWVALVVLSLHGCDHGAENDDELMMLRAWTKKEWTGRLNRRGKNEFRITNGVGENGTLVKKGMSKQIYKAFMKQCGDECSKEIGGVFCAGFAIYRDEQTSSLMCHFYNNSKIGNKQNNWKAYMKTTQPTEAPTAAPSMPSTMLTAAPTITEPVKGKQKEGQNCGNSNECEEGLQCKCGPKCEKGKKTPTCSKPEDRVHDERGYRIKQIGYSQKCLEVNERTKLITLENCSDSDWQRWYLKERETCKPELRHKKVKECMTPHEGLEMEEMEEMPMSMTGEVNERDCNDACAEWTRQLFLGFIRPNQCFTDVQSRLENLENLDLQANSLLKARPANELISVIPDKDKGTCDGPGPKTYVTAHHFEMV